LASQLLEFELAGMAMWHIGLMGSGFIPLALDLVPIASAASLSPLAPCLQSRPRTITRTKDKYYGQHKGNTRIETNTGTATRHADRSLMGPGFLPQSLTSRP
jgi:hypothetical protein